MTARPRTPAPVPAVPAHVSAYVEALGVDTAMDFLCRFGGSQIYIARSPTERSEAARAIGAQAVGKLARALGPGYYKIPIAKRWIAQVLFSRGESLNAIARIVRADVETVRRWRLAETEDEQLDLL